MPPKKAVGAKGSSTSHAAVKKPKASSTASVSAVKSPTTKKPVSKTTASTKGKTTPSKNLKKPTGKTEKNSDGGKAVSTPKETLAAVKIQSFVRRMLARKVLEKKRNEKEEYEKLIEKLQREAWLDIVKREREVAEKERQKEEEERRKKREETKRKKALLEAAFDGDKETIITILDEAKKSDITNAKTDGPALELSIMRHQLALIECEDANNNSLLSEASAGGHGNIIEFLINEGADINTRGAFNRTPLYRAAFGGHIQAVQILIENGADPRLFADDGNTPEQIAAVPEIAEIISSWDLNTTEKLLARNQNRKEQRLQMEKDYLIKQTKLLSDEISAAEQEHKIKQKHLQKAYEELNKRIQEHDKCAAKIDFKLDITLQSVHDAEEDLSNAKTEEEIARRKLSELRLKLREETSHCKGDVDPVTEKGVKCHIRELDDVLLRDVGDRIKQDGRWPLIIDGSGQAAVFLRYRDTNYLNALNMKEMEPDVIRKALLGAIRYGKFLVIDMMEVDMIDVVQSRMDEIDKELYNRLMTKDLLQKDKFLSLIRATDGEEYSKEKFNTSRIDNFKFLFITKMWKPPEKWLEMFYPIQVIVSS